MKEADYRELLEYGKTIPVVDTHEHVESEAARITRKADLFNTFMMHYASCDLVSAGMPDEDMLFLKGESKDLEKKWSVFEPWWEKARNTTYCKSLLYATKEIYGMEDINKDTYQALDARIKDESKPGLYQKVLKDISNIEISILDSDVNCDREFFVSTVNLDGYLLIKTKDIVMKAEKDHNLSIHSLTDWVKFIRNHVEEQKRNHGVVCVKSALAYQRCIKYNRTDAADAEKVFNLIMAPRDFIGWYGASPIDMPTKPLEDYLMHVLVQTAQDLDLPMQFHTGLQEGNGNFIVNSNPVHLTNLFLEYPKVRFDVFHAGYPYGGELCALAKNFRNVFVDLCWAHIISREYSIRFLEDLLDTVPMNKIFGFGGDYCFVEGVCGHLRIAQEDIARALANKMGKGYLSKKECMDVEKRLLNVNAREFFKL